MKFSEATSLLHSFSSRRQPQAEVFGAMLADPGLREIVAFCEEETIAGARLYAGVHDVRSKFRCELLYGTPPADAAREVRSPGIMPLHVDSAMNPQLKDRFFRRPHSDTIHFIDHQYVPRSDHASPALLTVGTTNHGLDMLPQEPAVIDIDALVERRSRMIKSLVSPAVVTNADIRALLRSEATRLVRIHVLGPVGTNCAQASNQYVDRLGIRRKSNMTVHPMGVEPMEYAEMAKQEQRPGVVPLHMECAVFYGMAKLDGARPHEIVTADHHDMPLDEMQLATHGGHSAELSSAHPLILASHPSPLSLVGPWIDRELVHWEKASSNQVAAEMVQDGKADVCITTESGRRLCQLKQQHLFGHPNMTFTLGTPLSPHEVRSRLRA
ncbi:hypothetical protein HY213_00990 [Candidatus Peregrinibacteria bacterium]|nr:hypothetical protein [Candidatus Peregrinibacteria bacterium]